LPALSPGNVTFASFNNAAKVSPAAVALWSKVLQAVPDARLMLKSKSFGDGTTVERLLSLFEKQGVASDRLEFMSWVSASDEHLALYNRAHIALDTFPYSGCTTTCEALWMGVPVITLTRDEPRSRMSLSVLSTVGLNDCIAESPEHYIDIARELATDIGKLRMMRSGLRERMQQSSLLDAASFTRAVETVYRDMWKRYLNQA
jgi:predicted O-linked N-acetylglucosamine transferase (SPINDLY family)